LPVLIFFSSYDPLLSVKAVLPVPLIFTVTSSAGFPSEVFTQPPIFPVCANDRLAENKSKIIQLVKILIIVEICLIGTNLLFKIILNNII
jgi:hypothetical protein